MHRSSRAAVVESELSSQKRNDNKTFEFGDDEKRQGGERYNARGVDRDWIMSDPPPSLHPGQVSRDGGMTIHLSIPSLSLSYLVAC